VPSAHSPRFRPGPATRSLAERLRGLAAALGHAPATYRLVWRADRPAAVLLASLSALSALFPAAIAWVGKLIVDAVVAASRGEAPATPVLGLVGLEAALMGGSLALSRLQGLSRELLRARLGNLVNESILEKALTLELRHFEDAAVYDMMQNARREASARPLSLVMQGLSVLQNGATLATLTALLFRVSPLGVLVLVAASVPAFVAEVRLAAEGFRLNTWRAPEGRKLNYLEWILTRDQHVKEVKLFGLGPLVLSRYRALFRRFYDEDRRLAVRRLAAGVLLGLLSLAAFYAMYAQVAARAARAEITLGDLALYLTVFRQGQGSIQSILGAIGAMYEDALYMSNLFAFLAIPTGGEAPRARPALVPPRGPPGRIEFRRVSFRYPGREEWALRDLDLTLEPGETLGLVGENGAGKSTLVKLLLRLYDPTEGSIRYGGVDLRDMETAELRSRFGAVFQDFVHYQFTARENVGLGLPALVEDRVRVGRAVERAGAGELVGALPQGLETPLGGWFESGHELSAGQWQKLAVARAFMREEAEVLILDEPTASIDAEAEHELFQRFRELAVSRSAIVISHRFSTVRIADRIAVLHGGRLVELGSHRELLAQDGRYAHLFRLQAQGYLD